MVFLVTIYLMYVRLKFIFGTLRFLLKYLSPALSYSPVLFGTYIISNVCFTIQHRLHHFYTKLPAFTKNDIKIPPSFLPNCNYSYIRRYIVWRLACPLP